MRAQRLLTIFALTASAIFGQSKDIYHPFQDIKNAFTDDSTYKVSPLSIIRNAVEASDDLPTYTSFSGNVQDGPRQDDKYDVRCAGMDCDFTLTNKTTLVKTTFQRLGDMIIIATRPEVNSVSLDSLTRGSQEYVQIIYPDNKIEARTCKLKGQNVFDTTDLRAGDALETRTILDYGKCGPLDASEWIPAATARNIADTLVDITKNGPIGFPVTAENKLKDFLAAAKDYLERQKNSFADIIKKVVTKNPLLPENTTASLAPTTPNAGRAAAIALPVAAKQ